jgi:DNA-directed RNA polymerase specialized sigma24 family protein
VARPYDHTSLGGEGRVFPPTEWTWLLHYPQRETVLAELCRKYWKPVYCYLRSMGLANEEAKDLTQSFFTEKVLGQDLIQKADREKGRFRSFLLRAAHNYAVSVKRGEKAHGSLHPDQEDARTFDAPEAAFNRAWADQLLHEVLEELEQECRQRNKLVHWRLFQEWILEPEVEENKAMSEICLKHGVAEASTAYHMIENVKRRFRALLRDRLSALAGSEQDIEAEIREFIEVFSGRPARK